MKYAIIALLGLVCAVIGVSVRGVSAQSVPPAGAPYGLWPDMAELFVPEAASPPRGSIRQDPRYTVIAWSDLGMHCISPRFAEMCILPPYNSIMAVVIRRGGEEPQVVSSGVRLTYALDGNRTVAGKTDFWRYAPKLFGKRLRPGIGLTGLGLTGAMSPAGNHFEAIGVPVLPYNDRMVWNPYQQATIRLSGKGIRANTMTSVVVAVSDEMDCGKCHATGGVAASGISTPTVEGNILTLHDLRNGTKLMASRPVLCAKCHSDNALAAPGAKGVSSLSLAMHGWHSTLAQQPLCYDCHPGTKTQCNRSVAPFMGPDQSGPRCSLCHGDLTRMAASLTAGRQPWLEEPTCAQCHGNAYSTGSLLYRKATGHGGVLCVACHNSPHAWWPSRRADDNAQPSAMQHNTHAIGFKGCNICHMDGRTGRMPPHGED